MGWCMFFIFFIRFISLSRSLMRCMSSMVCEFHLKCINNSVITAMMIDEGDGKYAFFAFLWQGKEDKLRIYP